jgi:nitroreductase
MDMNILEAIFTRRSIRKFTGEPVSEEDLQTILRAGSYAPSAHNLQPWRFIVVRNAEKLQAIADNHRYAKMLPGAGCCIVVGGDKTVQSKTGFLVEDCSAAIQNMLLAAHGLGLGTVWCGLYPVPKLTKVVKTILNLPPEIVPVGLFALGHKVEDRQVGERFDPSKVHYEGW